MSAAQITKAEGAAVAITRVSKRFGPQIALNNVSLAVEPGQVQCIIGPPGAGKSALLRCIGQSEAIDQGSIEIDHNLIYACGTAIVPSSGKTSQR